MMKSPQRRINMEKIPKAPIHRKIEHKDININFLRKLGRECFKKLLESVDN